MYNMTFRPKLDEPEKRKEVENPIVKSIAKPIDRFKTNPGDKPVEKSIERLKTTQVEEPAEPEAKSFSKPLIGGNASKPFGSKISTKPNFLSKVKEETANATSNISKDYEL